MVDDVCLAPLGAMQAGTAGALYHASIEQEVVQPVPPELLKGLLRKRLDRLEVRELQWKHCQAVSSAVKFEVIVGLLRPLRITRAEDEPVRLRLGQQLLHKLKTLYKMSVNCHLGEL